MPSSCIEILGMFLQHERKIATRIANLKTIIDQVRKTLHRIMFQTRGMGESDTLSLVQAFVVSRVAYSTPYTLLTASKFVIQSPAW